VANIGSLWLTKMLLEKRALILVQPETVVLRLAISPRTRDVFAGGCG